MVVFRWNLNVGGLWFRRSIDVCAILVLTHFQWCHIDLHWFTENDSHSAQKDKWIRSTFVSDSEWDPFPEPVICILYSLPSPALIPSEQRLPILFPKFPYLPMYAKAAMQYTDGMMLFEVWRNCAYQPFSIWSKNQSLSFTAVGVVECASEGLYPHCAPDSMFSSAVKCQEIAGHWNRQSAFRLGRCCSCASGPAICAGHARLRCRF